MEVSCQGDEADWSWKYQQADMFMSRYDWLSFIYFFFVFCAKIQFELS